APAAPSSVGTVTRRRRLAEPAPSSTERASFGSRLINRTVESFIVRSEGWGAMWTNRPLGSLLMTVPGGRNNGEGWGMVAAGCRFPSLFLPPAATAPRDSAKPDFLRHTAPTRIN